MFLLSSRQIDGGNCAFHKLMLFSSNYSLAIVTLSRIILGGGGFVRWVRPILLNGVSGPVSKTQKTALVSSDIWTQWRLTCFRRLLYSIVYYICTYRRVVLCAHECRYLQNSEEGIWAPGLKLQVVMNYVTGLGTKLGSSTMGGCTLYQRTVSATQDTWMTQRKGSLTRQTSPTTLNTSVSKPVEMLVVYDACSMELSL